jgi:alkylation response protein AidB-like acyl-CoA dehydrogenase
MNFAISPEQQDLRRRLAAAGAELGSGLEERERSGAFDRPLWRRLGEAGLHGLPFPAAYGGGGLDLLSVALGLEAFGGACRDEGLTFSLCAQMQSCAVPIWLAGSEEQRRRFLPGLAAGRLVGGNGTTEKGSGSDAFAMETTAARDGADYVLDGEKAWVTNGPLADLLLVYALTSKRDRQFGGISAFLVEAGTPGLSRGPNVEKMGLRTAPWCCVQLAGCRVPASHRLGAEGAGAEIFREAMEWERLLLSAAALGRMADTLERSLLHARTRKQFGKPIGRFQAIAGKLVQMKSDLESARLLLYKAAWLRDQGERASLEISLGKLLINESRVRSCLDAIQIHGAAGCTTDLAIERELRNAIPVSIASGTSEMQQLIIAHLLGI